MPYALLVRAVVVRRPVGAHHGVTDVLHLVADEAVADGDGQKWGQETERQQERHRRRAVLLHDCAAEGQWFVSKLAPNFRQRQQHQTERDPPEESNHQP